MKDDSEADVKPLEEIAVLRQQVEEMADIATQRTQVEQIRQSIEAAALQLAESTDFSQTVTRVLAQISRTFVWHALRLSDRSKRQPRHSLLPPPITGGVGKHLPGRSPR